MIDIISLLANICILLITIYTFYLTIFSMRINLVSISCSATTYHGFSNKLYLENKTLHPICITKIDLLKKINDCYYIISFMKNNDDPYIVEPFKVAKFSLKPYTYIDTIPNPYELFDEALIIIKTGNTKPQYLKPRSLNSRDAKKLKKIHKSGKYLIASVIRQSFNNEILSKDVKYIISYITDNCKTCKYIYMLNNGQMSESINGFTAIPSTYCTIKKKVTYFLMNEFNLQKDKFEVIKWQSL